MLSNFRSLHNIQTRKERRREEEKRDRGKEGRNNKY